MSLDCSAQCLYSFEDGNQLGSHNPRRTNGEEDCQEGSQEGSQEALSASHQLRGWRHPRFFRAPPARREFSLTVNTPKGGITMAKKTVKKAAKKVTKKR
jgi:hypothetical protein